MLGGAGGLGGGGGGGGEARHGVDSAATAAGYARLGAERFVALAAAGKALSVVALDGDGEHVGEPVLVFAVLVAEGGLELHDVAGDGAER